MENIKFQPFWGNALGGDSIWSQIKSTVSWHTSEGGGSWPGRITLWFDNEDIDEYPHPKKDYFYY